MDAIIEVGNMSKTFNSINAVDDISFNVERGELFGLLGVNGAGKSTTINILSTLYPMSKGEGRVCDYKLGKSNREIRNSIGVVFQENTLDSKLTVKENLISRGCLYEKNNKKIKENLEHISKVLELKEFLYKPYGQLSGGQKRRCEIARALFHRPEILFLDEPTTGLDPKTRQLVWECILYLKKQEGITIFLTTHYMEEAAAAEHIIVMDKGRLSASGTPFQLKEKYAQDKLRIEIKGGDNTWNNNHKEVMNYLTTNNYATLEYSNSTVIKLKSSMDAIDILNNIKDNICSFEVFQGTMEDAFLSITGNKRNEGGLE